MRCDDVASVLPGLVDGTAALERGAKRHVDSCLRCQAELVQYRKLVRGLRSLQGQVAPAPGLVGEILAAVAAGEVPQRASSASTARRAAYLSGLAAATAAGAAGAIVLATRARSRRLAS